jgi:AcrR family transcriptional regulator
MEPRAVKPPSNDPPAGEPALRRTAGRPRQLSLEKIVDAALEVGLENVTLTAVAAKLGVKPAALYTYVENKDALVGRVARRLMEGGMTHVAGQSWADIVREHVAGTVRLFGDEPQLLVHFMQGGFGPSVEMENVERFLARLAARGFTPEEALRIYRVAGQIALGAAAQRAYVASNRRKGEPHGEQARVEFARREGRYPQLGVSAALYADDDRYFSPEPALEDFLAGVAAARGEPLPPQARPEDAIGI